MQPHGRRPALLLLVPQLLLLLPDQQTASKLQQLPRLLSAPRTLSRMQ
jgi:hypothetical protein